MSGEVIDKFNKEQNEAHKLGYLGEKEIEVDIFLSILNNIKSSNVTFMELGAGYGEWCMALNGIIRNKLIDTNIKNIQCYAVEADPQHVIWIEKHFKQWNIEGQIIPFVITDKDGNCMFATTDDSATSYDQGITISDNLLRTANNILRRESIPITSIKLDSLITTYNINKIDLIDMDVQGNEVRVVEGALESIKTGVIDYWKIGTHRNKHNKKLEEILCQYYDLLIDMYPKSIGSVNGMTAKIDDGIQVYQRKGLN